MKQIQTSVLIVGGSLVGLSAAVFLAWRGVPTVLVEPHLGSHPHPRAVGYTARTMELFRTVGLGDAIPQAPADFRLKRARVESLAGAWHDASDWTPGAKAAAAVEESPCTGAAIAQDRLEPILRQHARTLGADLRLGTELTGFVQDEHGVTATCRTAQGEAIEIRADYMLAADGSTSGVRTALGIGRSGRGHMRTMRSVLFEAPLDAYLERGVSQFAIAQPGFQAFLTTYGDGRWVLMFGDDEERSEDELRAAILRAIGRTDVPVKIVTSGRWELTALIADRFQEGRVFLAGDAAHTLPPTRGGYGANTGIHDVWELSWKLQAVLAGVSRPELLATYDVERRPIAWERLRQTFARPDYAREANGIADGTPIREELAMELGELHRSAAILGAGDDLPPAKRPAEWSGQPGTRPPHAWLEREGKRLSTVDLFGRGWVLVVDASARASWSEAAAAVATRLGLAIEVVDLGGELARTFGIAEGGASLVRPDGIVAWRAESAPDDPTRALVESLARVGHTRAA